MHLSRLSISGFKSFAQRSELEFAPGITAVVGPNGSGKSNVADAIRWVLGEQSVKNLRGKKGHDLIFAGSSGRARASAAEVTLTIDNAEGRGKLPAELSVTRRVFRSGESEYLLGGKVVRLLDVVTLLAEAGFGQSSYAVISQGMVDSLLVGTPAERKALFDEAVGVRPYYLKRDQTIRNLQQTRENLDQTAAVLRELRPHLTTLERAARRGAERAELQAKFEQTASTYYGSRLGELESQLAESTKVSRERRAEIGQLEREIGALEREQAEASRDDSELAASRENLRRLEREEASLARELATIEGRIQAARESGGDLEHRATLELLARLTEELVTVQTELGQIEHKAKAVRKSEELARRERDRLRSEIERLRTTLSRLESEASTPTRVRLLLSEARAKTAELATGSVSDLAALAGELEQLLVKIEESLDAPDAELQSTRARLRELELSLGRAEAALQEVSVEAAGSTTLRLSLGDRAESLTAEVAQLKQKSKELEGPQADPAAHLEREAATLRTRLEQSKTALESEEQASQSVLSAYRERQERDLTARSALSEKQSLIRDLSRSLSEAEVEAARLETRRDDLRAEAMRELGSSALTKLTPAHGRPNLPALESELARLRTRLAQIGTVDPEVTGEHQELKDRFDFLTSQSADLEQAAGDLEKVLAELESLIKTTWRASFEKIAAEFSRRFTELFDGGHSEITVENLDDGELGIEIQATPPGKRLSEITALSGGERALTSAALLAAILTVNPSPFVVLDEVDAALDEANTVKFGQALEGLARKTQFILITHNRRTMELAGVLYGVTMDRAGVSRLLSLKLEEAAEVTEARP